MGDNSEANLHDLYISWAGKKRGKVMFGGQLHPRGFGASRLAILVRLLTGIVSIAFLALLHPLFLAMALIPLPLTVGISDRRGTALHTLLLVPNLAGAALLVQRGGLDAAGLCLVVGANWALLMAVSGIRSPAKHGAQHEPQSDSRAIAQVAGTQVGGVTRGTPHALPAPPDMDLEKPVTVLRRGASLPAPPPVDTDTDSINDFRTAPLTSLPRRQPQDAGQDDAPQSDRWSAESPHKTGKHLSASEVLFAAYIEGMGPTKLSSTMSNKPAAPADR